MADETAGFIVDRLSKRQWHMTRHEYLYRAAHARDVEIMASATVGLQKGYSPAELLRICRPVDFPEDQSSMPVPRARRRSVVWRQNRDRWELGQRRERRRVELERRRRDQEADVWTIRGMNYLIRERGAAPARALRRLFPRDFDGLPPRS